MATFVATRNGFFFIVDNCPFIVHVLEWHFKNKYNTNTQLNKNKISISYLARNSISGRNSMSLFVTFFLNFDLRAGSKFNLNSIFASHRVKFEQKSISYLARNSISGLNSMSLFVTFFQFRSSSWLEIQTQLDIRFT